MTRDRRSRPPGPWGSPHSQRQVQTDAACGNDLHLLDGIIAHAHDGPFTKGLLHLVHRKLECLQLLLVDLCCHAIVLLGLLGQVPSPSFQRTNVHAFSRE